MKAILLAIALTLSPFAMAQWPHDGVVPEQAQASSVAVPEPEYPYAGALVIVEQKMVIGVIMVGHDGTLEPINIHGFSQATLLSTLSQAPADKVIQITTSFCGPKST